MLKAVPDDRRPNLDRYELALRLMRHYAEKRRKGQIQVEFVDGRVVRVREEIVH